MHWILVGTAACWAALELRHSRVRRPAAVRAGWASEVLFRLLVAGGALVAGALSTAQLARIRHADIADWIGLALFWSGIALRQWSFQTLGRYFTFVVQTTSDQPVIADGPYRLIRHPGYAGLLLVVTAVGLLIGNWLSLVSLAVATAGALVFRIHVEEEALMRNLGDDYRVYAAAHKRLIPFIW